MADLRLLSSVLAPLALVVLLAPSCWTMPTRVVYTPEIAGRVIDHETGKPVIGAEVFVSRFAATNYVGHSGASVFYGTRWTTTDERGHFAFPAEDTPVPPDIQRWEQFSDEPGIVVIHPDYGRAQNARKIGDDSGHIEWEAVADRRTLRALSSRSGWATVCGGIFDRAGYIHCCNVFYGPDHVCVGR